MNGNPLLPVIAYLEQKAARLSEREKIILMIGLRAGHVAEALDRGDQQRAGAHARVLRELMPAAGFVSTRTGWADPRLSERERRILATGMLASHFEEALAQGRFDDARARARELWPLVASS